MNVEDTDSDEDWEGDQQHSEEEVLAEQRHRQGSWGNNLGQKQEEHSEGEKNGDAEGHLKRKCDKYCKNSKRILDPTSKFKNTQVFKYSSIQVCNIQVYKYM